MSQVNERIAILMTNINIHNSRNRGLVIYDGAIRAGSTIMYMPKMYISRRRGSVGQHKLLELMQVDWDGYIENEVYIGQFYANENKLNAYGMAATFYFHEKEILEKSPSSYGNIYLVKRAERVLLKYHAIPKEDWLKDGLVLFKDGLYIIEMMYRKDKIDNTKFQKLLSKSDRVQKIYNLSQNTPYEQEKKTALHHLDVFAKNLMEEICLTV